MMMTYLVASAINKHFQPNHLIWVRSQSLSNLLIATNQSRLHHSHEIFCYCGINKEVASVIIQCSRKAELVWQGAHPTLTSIKSCGARSHTNNAYFALSELLLCSWLSSTNLFLQLLGMKHQIPKRPRRHSRLLCFVVVFGVDCPPGQTFKPPSLAWRIEGWLEGLSTPLSRNVKVEVKTERTRKVSRRLALSGLKF